MPEAPDSMSFSATARPNGVSRSWSPTASAKPASQKNSQAISCTSVGPVRLRTPSFAANMKSATSSPSNISPFIHNSVALVAATISRSPGVTIRAAFSRGAAVQLDPAFPRRRELRRIEFGPLRPRPATPETTVLSCGFPSPARDSAPGGARTETHEREPVSSAPLSTRWQTPEGLARPTRQSAGAPVEELIDGAISRTQRRALDCWRADLPRDTRELSLTPRIGLEPAFDVEANAACFAHGAPTQQVALADDNIARTPCAGEA